MPLAAPAPFGDDLAGLGVTGGAIVLLVVLVVGVAAGRARSRFVLLLVGLAAVLVVGVAVSGYDPTPAGMSESLTVVLPLFVAYAAGWLAARGSWLRRLVVVGVAAVLLAAFPYGPAGEAAARWFAG